MLGYMSPLSDEALIRRDKYAGNADADLTHDLARLAEGEPLAYIIGWIPFLGLSIHLDSHPLIPRPETEWWTEELCTHLQERFGDTPFRLLDLCAGSGAIGLAVLARFPHAHISFAEIDQAHTKQIADNIAHNNLDTTRATIYTGDLFAPLASERFDIIATNPPYIPAARTLDLSVTNYEPAQALFSGTDGLSLITRIAQETPSHLLPQGELWLECDTTHTEEVRSLLVTHGAESAVVRTDLYGRPRIVVGYYR